MLANPQPELLKVAAFLNIQPTPEQLVRALELSSAGHMRKLEEKEAGVWLMTKKTRQDIPFVRTAVSGEWRTRLPSSCIAAIELAWAPLMRRLGYELSTADVPR
jgi:hypothetical protein